MSTSFLYHAYNIVGYKHLHTKYAGNEINFSIKRDRWLKCPKCKSKDVILKGNKGRKIRGIPVFHKQIFFEFETVRVECKKCGGVNWVDTGISEPWARHTKQFERYALELLKYATIQDVAKHLGVGWDTIKDIQKEYLIKKYKKPKLKGIEIIAIDEISIGSGHKYLTPIFTEVKSARV